jgi:hypothetical protein
MLLDLCDWQQALIFSFQQDLVWQLAASSI